MKITSVPYEDLGFIIYYDEHRREVGRANWNGGTMGYDIYNNNGKFIGSMIKDPITLQTLYYDKNGHKIGSSFENLFTLETTHYDSDGNISGSERMNPVTGISEFSGDAPFSASGSSGKTTKIRNDNSFAHDHKFVLLLLGGILILMAPFALKYYFGIITAILGSLFAPVGRFFAALFSAWWKTPGLCLEALKKWNLFRHFGQYWPYIPELIMGIVYPVRQIIGFGNGACDEIFGTDDFWKCFAPFMIIELLHWFTYRALTFGGFLTRGLGLGLGMCLIIAVIKKILGFISSR